MKVFKFFTITFACVCFLFNSASCAVKKDNGKHKGWSKNINNSSSKKQSGKSRSKS
jgi:hypothetical protein